MSVTSNEAFGATAATAERVYLREVFAWMILAVGLTTGVAAYLSSSDRVLNYFNQHSAMLFLLFILQFGLVIALSAALPRLTVTSAAVLFCVYAGLNGVLFAILFQIYTTGSVVGAFAGATGVFAGMAGYGYFTQRDLSGMGGILFGALIGLIVASVAFIFIGGETLNLIIGWGGVIIFSLLTAYDMQSIKNMRTQFAGDAQTTQKLAILGALRLYLDFINLVISLLRIFGNAR
jgi:FtsH-binding integral membrane protein